MSHTEDSIHGHEIIHMVADLKGSVSIQSLREEVTKQYGADARFHTCSGANLDFDGLIDFVVERGKLIRENDTVRYAGAETCNH